MKMVKSLLLGSAAGLVAVAGAQAADLPVKAKPVEYVKICSLYGVGFYYIPGTDMCIKIGGWVRAEYAWGVNGLRCRPTARTRTWTTVPPTTRGGASAVTSRLMPATRPNTVRCAATSRLVSAPTIWVLVNSRHSTRTAPSSSGPASPSVAQRRSLTSMLARRCLTSGSIRSPILVTAARTSSPIRHNSATASRPRLLPNCRGGTQIIGVPGLGVLAPAVARRQRRLHHRWRRP